MTLESSRDLGHGVRVVPDVGGGLVVLSERIDLGWRPQRGGRPGSAVTFSGSSYEVVGRQAWGGGDWWLLEPWSGEDVMRVVAPLDEASVDSAAAATRDEQQAKNLGPALWLLSPILGFAADSWQRRWRDRWGFPAVLATWTSALFEMLFGAACVIEIISSIGADHSIFPWIPRPVVFLGLFFLVEGLVRAARVAADSEPVSTFFGLVLTVFERNREAPLEIPGPKVESFDAGTGGLELGSTIVRRDWEEPGLLPYRGELFELDSARQLGEAWIYSFRRVEVSDGTEIRKLRLPPPPSRPLERPRDDGPGGFRIVLLSIASTIAPAKYQERWAWWAGVPAVRYTIFGALVELIGGLVNLGDGTQASSAVQLLNLFFVVEGALRMGRVIFAGKPMGSVFGLPLIPFLSRALPE